MNETNVCAGMPLNFCGTEAVSTCQAQNDAVSYGPKFPAFMSLLGSFGLMYRVFQQGSKRQTTDRLLFVNGIATLLTNIGFFVGQWSFHDHAFCLAQAFIIQIGTVNVWGNAALCTSFVLRICLRWTPLRVERIEPYMIALVVIWPTISAIWGLAEGIYTNAGLWCWVAAQYVGLRLAFFYGELWFLMAYSAICMALIVRTVYMSDSKIALLFSQEGPQSGKRMSRKTRQMAYQAILYVGLFTITWVPATINRVIPTPLMPDGSHCAFFSLTLAHGLFGPLGGFCQFVVHIYPALVKKHSSITSQSASRISRKDRPTPGDVDEARDEESDLGLDMNQVPRLGGYGATKNKQVAPS